MTIVEGIEKVITLLPDNSANEAKVLGFTHLNYMPKSLVDIGVEKNYTLTKIGDVEDTEEVVQDDTVLFDTSYGGLVAQSGCKLYHKGEEDAVPVSKVYFGKNDSADNWEEKKVES